MGCCLCSGTLSGESFTAEGGTLDEISEFLGGRPVTEATPEDASDASAAEPTESTGVATDASDSTSATPAEGAALTAASDATADAAAPRKTRLESQLGHYVDRFDQQVSVLQAQAGLTSPESTAKREAALAEIGGPRPDR